MKKALCYFVLFFSALILNNQAVLFGQEKPLELGTRLELFVDRYLIESMNGTSLILHNPVQKETAVKFDLPWEGLFTGYVTVLNDSSKFKMYYRGLSVPGDDYTDAAVTCYAESDDGINWKKPDLGIFEVNGTKNNNVVLAGMSPFSHNFAPFIDKCPGVPDSLKYKAMSGSSKTGLFGFVSSDGVVWKKIIDKPLITKGAFDSQNVCFWSESENCYVCYMRTWTEGDFSGFRTISRSTSKDFLVWTEPVKMTFGETPMEHLYTNQTNPYFRAPNIYISIPMRFMPGRKVLTAQQAKDLNVSENYQSDCADAVFMTSRGGNTYDRTFMEGFIRPGMDIGNWSSRAGSTACGILPTSDNEISIYKQANYAQPTAHIVRYALRIDGFVSVNAPYKGGEIITKPILFTGNGLFINYSTSAAGFIKVEFTDETGKPLDGYTEADCDEIIGDSIERKVTWKGESNLSSLQGRPIKIRFIMKDADLYSIRFK